MPPHSARCYQLFLEAADLPPGEQAALIERECGGDGELRKALEALLAADRDNGASDGWLEPQPSPSELPDGGLIGPYRLLSRLGHGGMGVVYLAERADGQDDQRVALKLISAGMFSSSLRSRFLVERRVLASLDHPAIARLFDAGIAAGQQPYLVLEYVEGVPIDRYCQQRQLAVRDRLRLFLPVCAAVQEAHRKLVVHRDIKPANILVTSSGQPKLLDFGIARMLAPDGSDTRDPARTAMLFTPNYASPEQVRGEAVGVGTDVYSLGVLLYQLLSGELPLATDKAPLLEAARMVEQEDPRPPSEAATDAACATALRGDLDTIILHALEKDAAKRYSSVESFAADIQRHLDGFPVQARGNHWRYRAAKYLRRHRKAVTAATALLLLAAGGVASIVQSARIAGQQRVLAEQRFSDLRELARSYMFELDPQLEAIPGTTGVRALMSKRSMTYLDRIGAESGGDSLLQREIANGYSKLATVLGVPVYANLGDRDGARQSIDKALRLRRVVLARKPDSVEDRLMLARTLLLDGELRLNAGDLVGAVSAHTQALQAADWVLSHSSEPTGRQLNAAESAALYLAAALGGSGPMPQLGDPVGAWPYLVRSQDLTRREGEVRARLPGANTLNEYRYSNLALVELSMARLCWWGLEQPQHAREHFERALDLLHTPGINLDNAEIRRKLAVTNGDFGTWLLEIGQFSAGRHHLEDALASAQRAAAQDPENLSAGLDRAYAQVTMGRADALTGNAAAGFVAIDAGLSEIRELAAASDGAVRNILLAGALALAGDTALACARIPAATGYYGAAVTRATANAGRYPADARTRIDLSRAEHGLARCYEIQKETELARQHDSEAAAAARWILGSHPDNALAQRLLKEADAKP